MFIQILYKSNQTYIKVTLSNLQPIFHLLGDEICQVELIGSLHSSEGGSGSFGQQSAMETTTLLMVAILHQGT